MSNNLCIATWFPALPIYYLVNLAAPETAGISLPLRLLFPCISALISCLAIFCPDIGQNSFLH